MNEERGEDSDEDMQATKARPREKALHNHEHRDKPADPNEKDDWKRDSQRGKHRIVVLKRMELGDIYVTKDPVRIEGNSEDYTWLGIISTCFAARKVPRDPRR